MTKIILKNGFVVADGVVQELDVLIDNGKIADLVNWGKAEAADFEVVDCKGKYIMPGVIDVHVHFRDPGAIYKEDFESGSLAAVSAGVTTVLDMPNNIPAILNNGALSGKRKLVEGRSYCNYGFYIGYDGKNLGEILSAENIAGVKVYMGGSTNAGGVSFAEVEELFKKFDGLVVVHAEDQEIIDENIKKTFLGVDGVKIPASIHSKIRTVQAEVKAIRHACELSKKYDKRLHVAHVSSEEGLKVIVEYKQNGAPVTCEVTPHHLTFSRDDYDLLGNFIKINPPVRDKEDVFALWKGLKFGDIDIVATDHAPHTIVEKKLPYGEAPSGVPGIETMLPLFLNAVNDKAMELPEVVKILCEKPADIFGLSSKGKIAKWYDADVIVVDLEKEKKVESKKLFTKCKWSPYDGYKFKG
ncbi:MAG: dihydroorotase, partial [Candidatus Gracilibacteria bacterium]|nr:dihydroorotase [Candidatus Gracilibacteria bacterium]